MISPRRLEDLLVRAQTGSNLDQPFFQALLDATVYAHVPVGAPPGHKGFMSFCHPRDGVTMVAFFTTKQRAQHATEGVARVVATNGRAFMQATRGAILALNPKDAPSCVLYPEEVAALLDEGRMAEVQRLQLNGDMMAIGPLDHPPDGLVGAVAAVLGELPLVEVAYLVSCQTGVSNEPSSVMLAIGCKMQFAERAVRALATALQRKAEHLDVVLDVMPIDPGEPPPWIEELKLKPVYRRSVGVSHPTAPPQYRAN